LSPNQTLEMLSFLNNGQITKLRDLNSRVTANIPKSDEKLRLSLLDGIRNYERDMNDEEILVSKKEGPLPATTFISNADTPDESVTVTRVMMSQNIS
jgi:hypothetical protein